ncbi:hypothetical protein ACGFNP_25705 [Nonomuraea sp. NPDC049269]|uniref:hypothetical protein n=1 Tax=Nonomuraea sp. NPDC049269 TaxID=3364349 RepID=UPI0037126370
MMGRHNIEPIPSHGNLPPEIAAIALPQGEGRPPLVILNAADKNPRATFSLFRPDLYVWAALGWLAERVIQWGREHQIAGAAISAVAAGSVGVVGANAVLDGFGTPAARPAPATVTIVATATLPQATFTVTPERELVTVAPALKTSSPPVLPARPRKTQASESPTELGQPSPTSKPTREPAEEPTTRTRTRRPEPTSSPTAQDELPSTAAAPPSTTSPPRTQESAQPSANAEQAAEPATPQRECRIEVGVDPVLDICVFG